MKQPTRVETEIKLRVRDVPTLLRTLRRLGARGGRRVFEENAVYDTAKADLRSMGCLLRIRFETRNVAQAHRDEPVRGILTVKTPAPGGRGPRSRYKARLERETEISDPQRWPAMLQSLGFRTRFRYEKLRTSFLLRGLHLSLDETPVGVFLELEGNPKAIDHVAKALGYGVRDYELATYYGLYAEDCRRRGVRPKNMVFGAKKIAKRALFT